MLKRHVLITSLFASIVLFAGCSQQTKEHAKAGNEEAAAESAGHDIKEHTDHVAAEADAAAQDAAEGATTAAAVTVGAAKKAGDAIADGADKVVAGTSEAVADGAEHVKAGADDLADHAKTHAAMHDDTVIVEEQVPEDEKY